MIRSKLLSPLIFGLVLVMHTPNSTRAADHVDAPSILIDGRRDINDSFLFRSPSQSNRTVMAMTVNPLAGIMSPATFSPQIAYDFGVDRNGDSVPDFSIRIRFSEIIRATGRQFVIVRYLFDDQDILAAVGMTGDDIALRGGGLIRADTFDDPFFFDLIGFQNGFDFSGMDFFEGFNVSGIVIEYPTQRLGGQNIGLIARTLERGFQQDRMGRPAINTVLIPSDLKDQFNATPTQFDVGFYGRVVEERITELSGDREYAAMITSLLLPDVLTFDQTSDDGFLNGRRLDDDVIDIELDVLTRGAVTTDMVDSNDREFTNTFPYLAPPH